MYYTFEDFALDTQLYILYHGRTRINLRPKVFQLLLYLLEHRDRVISKQELSERLWPDQFISDAALESCVRLVRQALGDSGRHQRFIQTRHGHGYRFVAHVTPQSVDPAPPAPIEPRSPSEASRPESSTDRAPSILPPLPVTAAESPGQYPADASPRPPLNTHAGELKIITILSCGLHVSPALQTGEDLDRLHSQVRSLYELAQHEVHRFGGTIPYVTGDRLTALFGAPAAQEDHAQRAVLAALGLYQRVLQDQRAAPGDTQAFAIRMGVHTGTVVVGGISQEHEIASAIIGNMELVAISLQEAAVPGTILCSAATARLVRGVAQLESIRPVTVASESAPVMTYEVVDRMPHAAGHSAHARTARRLVGRRREVATLRRLLTQVEDGRGHAIGIVGEPGMGKSRLLAEFRHYVRQRKMHYLEGRCFSYSTDTPYYPILALIRDALNLTELMPRRELQAHVHGRLRELMMDPEEDAPYLLRLLHADSGTERLAPMSPQAIRNRTFQTLRQLCIRSSQSRPLVIAIEDLQWIDATSEALITSLAEGLAGAPVLLVCTYRPGYQPSWLGQSYATQIALQPLTTRDSQRLIEELFATEEYPAPLVRRLLAQADGNPFFLEELAWTVLESGIDNPPRVVPNTIQAVLASRIDRLAPVAKNLLQVAAVIGKEVPLPWLEAVVDLPTDSLHQYLWDLQASEFLYETRLTPVPTYTFKHSLTQEVVYQSLLSSTRKPYHQRIASVLKERFADAVAAQPELLAHHYTEADLGQEALPYWIFAGHRAIERSANAEAIGHLTRGLDVLQSLPTTPEHRQQELSMLLLLGTPLLMLKGHTAPEVQRAYARAHELSQEVGESPQLFWSLTGLWRFYLSQARLRTAYELSERCFTLAQRLREPSLLQESHLMMGSALLYLGELRAARTHLEQGVSLSEAQQGRERVVSSGTDSGVACLARASLALWALGYPDTALRRAEDAIALAQRRAHVYSQCMALFFATSAHANRREVAAEYEKASALIALAEEHEFILWVGLGVAMRGWALVEQGLVERGIEELRRGIAICKNIGGKLGVTHLFALLAEAHGKGERPTEGLDVLAEAFAMVEKNEERHREAELYRTQGDLLLRLTPPDAPGAEASLQRALDIARRQSGKSLELRAGISLSRLWAQQGKRAAARRLLAPIYEGFTEGFDTLDLREAQGLLASLG